MRFQHQAASRVLMEHCGLEQMGLLNSLCRMRRDSSARPLPTLYLGAFCRVVSN